MPNGRNSGRLYPGIPGDREIFVWHEDEQMLWIEWEKEGTRIGPLSSAKTREEAEKVAKDHGQELVVR